MIASGHAPAPWLPRGFPPGVPPAVGPPRDAGNAHGAAIVSNWLRRWFGGAAPPPQLISKVATPAKAPPQSTPPAAPPPTDGPVFGSRSPLLGPGGQLAGFYFAPPPRQAQHALRLPAAQTVQALALVAGLRPTLEAGQQALITLPLAVAQRPAVSAQLPAGLMLALTDGPPDEPLCRAWRRQGVRVGSVGAAWPDADFSIADAAELSTATPAPRHGRVVLGLPSIDAVEAALAAGAALAGGDLGRRGNTAKLASLTPRTGHIAAMLNLLLQDTEPEALAAELQADMALLVRLLTYANSAWNALPRQVASASDAVSMLGRDKLMRWLTLRLTEAGATRGSSPALQEVALARGRLLERLAPALGPASTAPPAALFTVGLLSLLDVLQQQDMADALRPLNLPRPTLQALLEGTGPWAGALALARAVEAQDSATAADLAVPFGGLDPVLAEADAAWHWARQMLHAAA